MPVKPNDIFLLCLPFIKLSDIPLIDMKDLFQRPHNYGEVFYSVDHYTEDGNYAIASKIFEHLKESNFYSKTETNTIPTSCNDVNPDKTSSNLELAEDVKEKLEQYKNILMEFYGAMFPKPNPQMKIGAIVMNCNPFTLGHRYLIEQAAARVSHLMIFVVQEDKSIFPFDDRLELVDKGVADLKNVSVIPSGQFIISSLTFSEYFEKSEIQDRTIDSSLDVTLFGQEIAPCLNISVRFVGEEPFDKITKQYNDTLRDILPRHGIEFMEIPRKECNGEAISASRVRKLLDEKNFDEIANMVPQTTLDYLIKRFS
jgi:[citrate (pro-3S)-lyase] ligase